MSAELIGEHVELVTMQGESHGVGKVIAYTDAPTVVIEAADGTRESWRADLTRLIPAVELPTEPTLGWLTCSATQRTDMVSVDFPMLAKWSAPRQPDSSIRKNNEACGVSVEWVTAFTPATAVPTAALDELRATLIEGWGKGDVTALFLRNGLAAFLAAVDEARP